MSQTNALYTILDGGMGTTLEDSGHNVGHRLWSSDPSLYDAVKQVHVGFLNAGSDMIGTATYQSADFLYAEQAPKSANEQIHGLMRKPVQIAHEACQFTQRSRTPAVALCLGPYGATLQPSQDYEGQYPYPFGTESATPTDEQYDTNLASLARFHETRLLTFARNPATWDSISWVCFETVPITVEARAIRQAVQGANMVDKPFWISFVFPHGPSSQSHDSSVANRVRQVMTSDLPIPSALGFNCTSPEYAQPLARQFTETFKSLLEAGHVDADRASCAFVMYPDGGLVYDTLTRTWTAPPDSELSTHGTNGDSWAQHVANVALEAAQATWSDGRGKTRRVWERGVMVGGCCKTGFTEIRELKAAMATKFGPST